MSLTDVFSTRLQALHARTAETPLFNPVSQLGLEISRQIETGTLSLDAVEGLIGELECIGLQERAVRLARLVEPSRPQNNFDTSVDLANPEDFEAFASRWARPVVHVVFTAHPTFLLSQAQYKAVAAASTMFRANQNPFPGLSFGPFSPLPDVTRRRWR